MNSDETDMAALADRIAAVRERIERREAEQAAATARAVRTAGQLRDAAEAAGLTWTGLGAARAYGLDLAAFWVGDPADGWRAQVCVIPAGWDAVRIEAIHECRERLAAELLGRLRKTARPDGSWPEEETTRAVRAWMLDHGVNADLP
jgi:hypothetical protein